MLGALLTDLLLSLACDGLDAPQFRRREACHRTLYAAGELAAPALARHRPQGEEGRRRRGQLLARLASTPRAELAAYLGGARPLPWLYLDGSYHGEAYRRACAAHADGFPLGGPDYPAWREACRRWAKELRAAGATCADVLRLLRPMQSREALWRAANE